MDETKQEISIKVYIVTPLSAHEEGGVGAQNPSNLNPNKRRAIMAKGVQKNALKDVTPGKLLPDGNTPDLQDGSTVDLQERGVQPRVCFHGLHTNLYYGFVTPTGLSVLKSGLLDVAVPKDHKFRLAFTYFFRTIISATVFLAIIVSNHMITNCLFRQNTKT
ncbi:hypothetical protein Fmac_026201 [Flemingia macrophylla]|uniref:Uncharacterized protein n=1 Tax=Flemingia macrophylla TaxID=520843 RepID=A0ABD1LE67_9FABA